MAQAVETIERDGRKITVYDNGLERDAATGRIVKPASGTVIKTAEQSSALHRKRQEKTARLLRQAIVRETADKLEIAPELAGSAPAAVAAAGGILWRDIVLADPNDPEGVKAYPRDRLEAWSKIGERAGILATAAEQRQQEQSTTQTIRYDVSPELAALLREVRQLQAGTQQQAGSSSADVVDAEETG